MNMKPFTKRRIALLLAFALIAGLLPLKTPTVSKAAGYGLSNPRITEGVTTWDCIWFGNYWQEDTNGDGTADKNDAKTPIKWRVLSVDGDDAFLLADKNLDVQRYNDTDTDVTWETCTMRSWLNGYGASDNVCRQDYSSGNFLDYAFTAGEQSAIKTTTVVNEDNPNYGTEGGNDTSDRVYLLSLGEVTNPDYGFTTSTNSTETREAVNTAYVAAGGEINSDYMNSAGSTAYWWLRSPGYYSCSASDVPYSGYVNAFGDDVFHDGIAARPALHLNLKASSDAISTSSWSYAGTVTSDGGADEEATPVPGETPKSDEDRALENIEKALPNLNDLGSAQLKGPEINIAGNKFNLFQKKCSLSLPIFDNKNLQIKVNETEHTAEVLLGIEGEIASDPNDPYWRETYRQVKSLVKACGGKVNTTKLWNQFSKLRGKLKKMNGNAVFSVSGNSAGYIKLQLDENYNPIRLIEGGVMAGLEASGKVKTPLWWIVYSEFGVGGSVDGKLCLTTENTKTIQVQGELGLAIKPSITLGADAVVVDVKGGIEGEIGGKVAIPWKSFEKCVSAWLTGKLFVKVDTIIPGLSGGYDFNFPKMELYPNLGKVEQRSLELQYTLSSQPTQRQIGEIKRYASGAVDTAKQALVYENAKPEMVELPDGRILMTYLDDTVSTADGQAKLMYRIYQDGSWSDGKPVNGTTNLDTAGKLCVYNGTAYVLYENSRQAVTEEMTQEEILNSMDLFVAAFDSADDTFATPIRLGEISEKDSAWKYGYDFVVEEDALTAVWAENSEGDVLLESGNTDFYGSSLSESGWQEKSRIDSVTGAVPEFCVQITDGDSHLFYIKDGVLYVDGNSCEVSGKRADSVKQFDGILYFRLDGQLYRWSDGEAVPLGVACTTSYRVSQDTVYWTEQDNFTSEIYKKDCNSENRPVAVTDEGGYIGSFCLLEQSDGKPLLTYTLQSVDETAESGNPYGLTLLKFSEELSRNQAQVTNLAYDILSFTPGAENDIAVTVANTGTTELTQVKVIISDEKGNTLHEEVISVSLNPGEVLEKHFSVLIPEELDAGEIQAAVSAEQEFASLDEGMAKLNLEMVQADISIASVNEDTIRITNQTEQSAENVTLTLKDSDETGAVLRSENIGSLTPGESREVSVAEAWSDTTLNTVTGQHYLYCDVTQEAMEYALWDNSLQLLKEADKIPPKPVTSPSSSPIAPGTNTGTDTPQVPVVVDSQISSTVTNTVPSSVKLQIPAKVTKLKVAMKKKQAALTWKKVYGAKGYQVCYSTSKKFKKKKRLLVKKNKATLKKLKSDKTYYIRVRAYTTDGSKKVYGKWSKVVKKKCKKS